MRRKEKEGGMFFRNIESCHKKSWSGAGLQCLWFWESRAVLCCSEVTCSPFQRLMVRSRQAGLHGKGD